MECGSVQCSRCLQGGDVVYGSQGELYGEFRGHH
jgi:hypothetical protein